MTGRSCVSVDKFGPFQIRREYHLTANQASLLASLTLQADWRTGVWTGTVDRLTKDTGLSRDTIRKVRTHLAELGLIHILKPFRGGEGSEAAIAVLGYPRLVPRCDPGVKEFLSTLSIDSAGNGPVLGAPY